ncbi:MAG: heme exporter protein CcmB [Deltaproteobacteria bacterium]|nr:heme exporter protein CcmB [Deltaproteobacteria bacterium]
MWSTLWRIESRGIRRDVIGVAELIGFVVLSLLIFAFVTRAVSIPAPLILWVTLLFGGVLYLGRSFDREWASDGSRVLEGLRMIPGAIPRLFWVKWGSNSLVLLLVSLLATGLLMLFLEEPGGWLAWSWLPLVIGLCGFSALGTLFAAGVVMQTRREYLLAILCYPLAIPLILAVSQCLTNGLATGRVDPVWIKLTAGCALLYITVASLLFPYLVEE